MNKVLQTFNVCGTRFHPRSEYRVKEESQIEFFWNIGFWGGRKPEVPWKKNSTEPTYDYRSTTLVAVERRLSQLPAPVPTIRIPSENEPGEYAYVIVCSKRKIN